MEVWGHRVWRGNGSTKWQSRGGMVGVVPELGAGKEEVRGTKRVQVFCLRGRDRV